MLIEETQISSILLPLDRIKDHLRLGTGFADDAAQDGVLDSFLRAALAAVEGQIGKVLLQREFSWTIDKWQNAQGQFMPASPIDKILSLVAVDAFNVQTGVGAETYTLKRDLHAPVLSPISGHLPNIPKNGHIKINFIAGFCVDFDDLPHDLSQAVLLLAAHYYENRNAVGMVGGAIPFGVSVLLERYKTIRILGGARA